MHGLNPRLAAHRLEDHRGDPALVLALFKGLLQRIEVVRHDVDEVLEELRRDPLALQRPCSRQVKRIDHLVRPSVVAPAHLYYLHLLRVGTVSYTHLTLPTIYSV